MKRRILAIVALIAFLALLINFFFIHYKLELSLFIYMIIFIVFVFSSYSNKYLKKGHSKEEVDDEISNQSGIENEPNKDV